MRVTARIAGPAVLLLALSACASAPTAPDPAVSGPRLTAALTTPTDIDLRWRGGRPDTAGHVLEFATDAAGPYTVLRYLAARVTAHRHPDLMPHTIFFYRLRAYRGPASPPVRVDLPDDGPAAAEDGTGHDRLPPRKPPGRTGAGRPLLSSPAAAPSALRAEPKEAHRIHFTWTDNSSDEDGFLLEIRTGGSAGYDPLAVLGPDVTSTGLLTLPGERHASYRIRAFRLGERSGTVRLTTGG